MTAFSFQIAAQPQTTQPEPTFPSIPSAETLTGQLLAYDFPAGFAERLAHEEGWTLDAALGVLREYRRFVVLAATAGQSVTPSKAVDAAWHLHLTHTRDYWLRLTPLLPAALHHDPSGNLAGEAEHFAQQYLATLTLYRARFGEPDPLIWPDPLNGTGAATPAPPRTNNRRLQSGLTLLVLWVVGGAALLRFGSWAVVILIGLGFVLLLARQSAQRPRSTPPASSDGDGFLGFSSFLAGFGDGGCDSSSSDSSSGCSSDGGGGDGGGSGCGSGCGGGCGS